MIHSMTKVKNSVVLAGMHYAASDVEPHGRALLFSILPLHAHLGYPWSDEHESVQLCKWQT